jgi:uncharacterized protein
VADRDPATTTLSAARPRPVAGGERLLVLDVLRGFAITGILWVNAPLMLAPVYRQVLGSGPEGTLDGLARALVEVLAEGKFFTLFSLLFGIGVAIQMRRAEARGTAFRPFFLRRMAVLAAFGVAHVVLLWWGDILVYYALLGLLLLPLRRAPPARVLRWALVVLIVPIALGGAFAGLSELAARSPDGAAQLEEARLQAVRQARAGEADALATYRGSDVASMARQRLADWAYATIGVTGNGMLAIVLAMFLLGLATGKLRILDDLDRHRRLLRAVRAAGWLLGAAGTAAWLVLRPSAMGAEPWAGWISTTGFVLGAPALSLGYAATLALALRRPAARRILAPLAAVGRTALSNYLLQSLVVTTLAYGYGAGLYGRVGPAGALAITAAVLAVQIPLSVAWTRRFRYGPAEWLWRALAYGRPPRGRRDAGDEPS